jgi:hypothetical protein
MKELNKVRKSTSRKKTVRETPVDRLAGFVKIKEDISRHFIKKENGYICVSGTCP